MKPLLDIVRTDIHSVKANNSQDPKARLSEYEMISQIRSEHFEFWLVLFLILCSVQLC